MSSTNWMLYFWKPVVPLPSQMFLWPFTFTAEIKAKTLLLQHIHFPVYQSENQACTVDHAWLKTATHSCGH